MHSGPPAAFTWAVRKLKANKDIVVKLCDKNLGVCVISRADYEREGLRQLLDASTYTLQEHPILPLSILERFEETLREYNMMYTRPNGRKLTPVAQYILQAKHQPSLQKFGSIYFIFKVHKDPVVARPIVASIGSITYHASKYVSEILLPVARRARTYIRDSTELVGILEHTTFPSDCVILTADVVELYPSIVLQDGLAALRYALGRAGFENRFADFITDLAALVLRNNYIRFGDKTFLQIKGTAMGTPLAVAFAIIYLAVIEEEVFLECAKDPLFRKPYLLKRFIDDIFSLFASSYDALLFVSVFNNRRPGHLRLTHNLSLSNGVFMDIEVFKGPRFNASNHFDLRLYQKPMNLYLYLPSCSFHPVAVKRGFIRAELARLRLRCTSDTDYTTVRDAFYQRLGARGYSHSFLTDCFDIALDRSVLVKRHCRYNAHPKQSSHEAPAPLLFSVPYSERSIQLRLKDCLVYTERLWADMESRYIFDERRQPIVCFLRPRNLGEYVVSSTYKHQIEI
jgi:hypothetical protein